MDRPFSLGENASMLDFILGGLFTSEMRSSVAGRFEKRLANSIFGCRASWREAQDKCEEYEHRQRGKSVLQCAVRWSAGA